MDMRFGKCGCVVPLAEDGRVNLAIIGRGCPEHGKRERRQVIGHTASGRRILSRRAGGNATV